MSLISSTESKSPVRIGEMAVRDGDGDVKQPKLEKALAEPEEPTNTPNPPLVNGQHSTSPSSSTEPKAELSENGDSKNDTDVPPDPASGILRSYSLSDERLSHIQIVKVVSLRISQIFTSPFSELHKSSKALHSM
jgi:hypothetical protein